MRSTPPESRQVLAEVLHDLRSHVRRQSLLHVSQLGIVRQVLHHGRHCWSSKLRIALSIFRW